MIWNLRIAQPLLLLAAVAAENLSVPPVLAQETFNARLSTVPIEAATAARITGSGAATATLDGRRLSIAGTFRGLQGAATAARLHAGPAMAIRGPSIHALTVMPARQGSIGGSVELTRAEVAALREGRMYIQLHSESAPDGNLWGWLLP